MKGSARLSKKGVLEVKIGVTLIMTGLFLLSAMIISGPLFEVQGQLERSSGEKPEGYYDIQEIMGEFPSIVIHNGTYYDIEETLTLSSSYPLFLGPGDSLRFKGAAALELAAPPVFDGTSEEPVVLSAFSGSSNWEGVKVTEADPLTTPIFNNVTISNATIGVRTIGSDLKMTNSEIVDCRRSGVESQGTIPETNSIDISDTRFIGCESYGINIQKIGRSRLDGITMDECGIGIKTYSSDLRVANCDILNSGAMGAYFVETTGSVTDSIFGSMDDNATVPSFQITYTNSSMSLENSGVYNAMTCISALSGSEVQMISSTIRKSVTDVIQAGNSRLIIEDCTISEAIESGIHLEGSSLEMSSTDLEDNGDGSASTVYSSIFMKNSVGVIELGSIIDSSDSHSHLVNSSLSIKETELDGYGNSPFILDLTSSLELMNTALPPEVRFLDPLSTARASISDEIEVIDHESGSPVDMVQIEITNRNGVLLDSVQTDPDGSTPEVIIPLYVNSTTGTMNMMPITITAVKDGYEISQILVNDRTAELRVVLYPPNSPPELQIITPTNGTEAGESLTVSGYIYDDLGIFRLRYRIDSGQFYDTGDLSPAESGYFEYDLKTEGLSSGEHRLWLYAFDGSHLSPPTERLIESTNAGLEDTDSDGIPDILEDKNGNGIVDANETDPEDPDTDGDGLMDGIEIDDTDGFTTDPLDPDSDGDFITDGLEDGNGNGRVDANETDPNKADTDGDGYSDFEDRYPLDETRWEDISQGDENATTTLILIILVFILLVILGYSLYQRLGGARRERGDDQERRERIPKTPGRISRGRGQDGPGRER